MNNIKLVELMAKLFEVIIIWKILDLKFFSKAILKLLLHTWIKIIIRFSIRYKPTLQKMEDLLKLSLKTIVSKIGIAFEKLTLTNIFEKVYKIRVVIVFPVLIILVLQYLSLDLT